MRFEVVLKGSIQGCKHPDRKYDIGIIDVKIPDIINKEDGYELTEYFENTYKFFVLSIPDLI